MAVESFDSSRGDRRAAQRTSSGRAGKRSLRVSDALRRDIVLGLLPPRDVLLELELAERFDCSQSTVRESLLALQEEGLVVRMPHRGTQVAECLRDDMIELIRLRHDIETRGVRRVIDRWSRLLHRELESLVAKMRDAAGADDEYALSELDRRFHLRLYEEAGLPSVEPVLLRCLIHNHRYKILNTERHASLVETADRHMPIIEALSSGDADRAVDALSLHITTIVDFGPNILAAPSGGAS